jgi:gluconokinase
MNAHTGAAAQRGAAPPALRIVVMGVSGCGKSTVGRALAEALGVPFIEGDELHPPRNIALMASGVALTDADRQDWLAAIAGQLGAARDAGRGIVVSCSALKRSYRDLMRAAAGDVRFVHLHGPADLLERRLGARSGHYMPATLLRSQLDTLEIPGPDEAVLAVAIGPAPETIVAELMRQLAPEDAP